MDDIVQVPANFIPRWYQLLMFQAMDGVKGKPETKKKRVFLRWHRRGGKDKNCFAYMSKEAASVPGNYYYIFPTQAQGKKALWNSVDRDGYKVLDHLPKELISGKPNSQEMIIKLTNGSTIQIVGLDTNSDSIRGVSCKGAVFSEFAYQDPEAYKVLMPSVRESDGWVIWNSTPQGRNHMYKMDVRIRNNPKWHYSVLQTLWPDRPHYSGLVSPQDLKEIQEEEGYTDDDMEREYGVAYSAGMKGAFYAEHVEKARDSGRIGNYPAVDHKWVDTFWDLGQSDDTVIWFRQMDGGRIVWVDYFEENNKDIAFYVDILSKKGYKYRTHYLPHDGGHKIKGIQLTYKNLLYDTLKEARLSTDIVVCPRLGVQDGINAIRSRFSRYHFNEGTTMEAIEKLALYHRRYDSKRQVFLKEPAHDWTSHCADALRTEASAEEYEDEFMAEHGKIQIVNDYDIFG